MGNAVFVACCAPAGYDGVDCRGGRPVCNAGLNPVLTGVYPVGAIAVPGLSSVTFAGCDPAAPYRACPAGLGGEVGTFPPAGFCGGGKYVVAAPEWGEKASVGACVVRGDGGGGAKGCISGRLICTGGLEGYCPPYALVGTADGAI